MSPRLPRALPLRRTAACCLRRGWRPLSSWRSWPIAGHVCPPQAFHGLAVTLVYKYADAIVKNFANSSASASRFSASLHPPTPPTRPCVVPATALLV